LTYIKIKYLNQIEKFSKWTACVIMAFFKYPGTLVGQTGTICLSYTFFAPQGKQLEKDLPLF
jgi:hypothetical protein